MSHLLSIDDLGADGIDEVLQLTDSFVEVSARAIPKVPALRGQDGRLALLRGLDPHPAQLRDRGQAARRRHDDLHRRFVVASTRASRSATRSRRSRRWASTPSSCATAPPACRRRSPAGRRSTRDQRRRRLARAPDPGAARLLHDPPAARASLDGPAHRDRRRHQAQPGRPVATCWPSPRSAPTSPWWRRRRCCRRASTGGRSTVSHDLDEVVGKTDVVYLLRMQRERMNEALVPSLREYTAALRPHRRRAPIGCRGRRRHRDASRPDEPGRRDRGRGGRSPERGRSSTRSRNGVPVRMAVLFLLLGAAAGDLVTDPTVACDGDDRG